MNQLEDDALDRALAALPRQDLSAMEARGLLIKAEARLREEKRLTRWMRVEPATITLLAFVHLGWALARLVLSP